MSCNHSRKKIFSLRLEEEVMHVFLTAAALAAQTLTDKEYQRLRDASVAIIREMGVECGGSNVQMAINPADGEARPGPEQLQDLLCCTAVHPDLPLLRACNKFLTQCCVSDLTPVFRDFLGALLCTLYLVCCSVPLGARCS